MYAQFQKNAPQIVEFCLYVIQQYALVFLHGCKRHARGTGCSGSCKEEGFKLRIQLTQLRFYALRYVGVIL